MLAVLLLLSQASAIEVNINAAPPARSGWFDRIRRRERVAITREGQVCESGSDCPHTHSFHGFSGRLWAC